MVLLSCGIPQIGIANVPGSIDWTGFHVCASRICFVFLFFFIDWLMIPRYALALNRRKRHSLPIVFRILESVFFFSTFTAGWIMPKEVQVQNQNRVETVVQWSFYTSSDKKPFGGHGRDLFVTIGKYTKNRTFGFFFFCIFPNLRGRELYLKPFVIP
jgi:hypothetical protein